MFALHPRLAEDTLEVVNLPLCRVLLMNDRTIPWLILVPAREGLVEMHHLTRADRATLMEEMALAAAVLEKRHAPHKINIGALGNLVPQLHVHVLARYREDRAWPGPVWGALGGAPYPPAEQQAALAGLRQDFAHP